MTKRRWMEWAVLGLAALLNSGCQPVSDAWMTGWTGAAAQDQIMLVRRDPPSLGQLRLTRQSGVYPDLGIFLKAQGMPDFLAEANTSKRHFLILYYLDARHAYACRARAPGTRQIEFTGPYAMTKRECELLQGFKKQAAGERATPASR